MFNIKLTLTYEIQRDTITYVDVGSLHRAHRYSPCRKFVILIRHSYEIAKFDLFIFSYHRDILINNYDIKYNEDRIHHPS